MPKDSERVERVRQAAMRMAERVARSPKPIKLPKSEVDVLLSRQKVQDYENWKKRLEEAAVAQERREYKERMKAEGKRVRRASQSEERVDKSGVGQPEQIAPMLQQRIEQLRKELVQTCGDLPSVSTPALW